MKIISKKELEKKVACSFLEFLFKNFSSKDLIQIEEAVVKKPDFYYAKKKILLELSTIYEFSDNEESARWSKIVHSIKDKIKKNPKFKDVSGLYSIDSGRNLILPAHKHSEYADQILDAIHKGFSEVSIEGYQFTIKRFESNEKDIVFAGFGQVRSIDSSGIILANISKKIKIANEQLGNTSYQTDKKILLLVNRFHLGSVDDVVKALSNMYSELMVFENIDEIWLQQEGKDKNYHTLLYTKNFIKAFEDKKIDADNKIHSTLFERWYWALEELPDKKANIFNAFQKFFSKHKPFQVFNDVGKRQSMVKFGEYLLNKDQISNALWLIDNFIDDPDPALPKEYKGKPEFNYHQRIIENKDVNVITTVQGHLAWVVKELARKSTKDDITNLQIALRLTKDKLSVREQNLYIILQWLFPLIEIANRRLWIANKNGKLYGEFRSLFLDQENGLVARYSGFKEIARNLIQVLNYFKDLTSDEAEYVIKKLLLAPEADAILVYFALYRERHYKIGSEAGDIISKVNRDILTYSPDKLQTILKNVLIDSDRYKILQEGTTWQFWKILKDEPDEFCNLADWINLLFEQPYSRSLYSKLELIIEDWYEKPTKCANPTHTWLLNYIQKVTDYVKQNKSGHSTDIWLSIDNVLNQVAEKHPQDLQIIMNKLFEIWMGGAFIGDLQIIFNSYQNINDLQLKTKIKTKYIEIYGKMKVVNPKITPVIF